MNITQIERLREAAKEHGEVFDLLMTLAGSFPFLQHGNSDFKGTELDLAYLESAILAAEFAKYDCDNCYGHKEL